MKGLRVGMRVRILWSRGFPELAEKCGTIVAADDGTPNYFGGISDWIVAPDEWGSCRSPYCGSRFAPTSSQLEPLSDANQTMSWSDPACVWRPEGVPA